MGEGETSEDERAKIEDSRTRGLEGNKRGLEVARAGGREGGNEAIRVRVRDRGRRGEDWRTRGLDKDTG